MGAKRRTHEDWAGLIPTCQRRVRQLRLETYVPMGGEWIPDRAETSPYS